MLKTIRPSGVCVAIIGLLLGAAAAVRPAWAGSFEPPEELLTSAERSGFTATARYDDVVALADRLADASPLVRKTELGKSVQGRSIPLLLVADPPVATRAEAARSGKLVVLLFANIHAGEVEGKEALMMLVREIVTADPEGSDEEKAARGLLKDLVLAVVPIYNADGNENVGPAAQKRQGQNGPDGDIGTRENADGLDLNRDYVKLEAPETRALVHFIAEWDPAAVIDCHTTNGSHHRYALTYMGPTNPAGNGKIVEYVRDELLPEVGKRLEAKSGYKTFFYGNFEGERGGDSPREFTKWTTYPDQPRYGTPYVGLRNRLGILSEAYSYAPFKDRVLATRDFCRLCLDFLAEHKDAVRRMLRQADEGTVAAGREPKDDSKVVLRSAVRAFDTKVTALGFVEEEKDGRRVATDQPKDYTLDLVNNFVPTLEVDRPVAYLFPKRLANVVENLQRHGIQVDELREDIELDVEVYKIEAVTKAMRTFQKHDLMDVRAAATAKAVRVPAGTMVVRTAQKLGTLAAYLLEPQSADGLAAWNFFDEFLSIDAEFPVWRLPAPPPANPPPAPLLTCAARPLADYREMDKPITYEVVHGDARLNLGGSPIGGVQWLDDGEHYLQVRDGALRKFEAATGRSEKFFDSGPMVAALGKLPTVGAQAARGMAGSSFLNMNPQRTAALFNHENDLYYATFDGDTAARLTSTPEAEEEASFSPDGKFVAFIRSNDLWCVDLETRTERELTTGGTNMVRNGKNDWVYYEEVFNRNWRAYWWSPDSKRLLFFQIDSTAVPGFKLAADHSEPRIVEEAPYPEPGQPNPSAKLGIVAVTGGSARWVDLSDYDPGQFLITGAGWLEPKGRTRVPGANPPGAGNDGSRPPGSESRATRGRPRGAQVRSEQVPESGTAFCYIQNRTQTWMDLLAVPAGGGKPKRLMRETTQAWVEPQGDPYVLKDGSFIVASERDGYRHYYRFERGGKLINQLTSGPWEARTLAHVDEENGLLYTVGTAEGWTTPNLFKVGFDGTGLTRVTRGPLWPDADAGSSSSGAGAARGAHSVSFSPTGRFFTDSWSDHTTPTRVGLFDSAGTLNRVLDSNPVYAVEEYRRGEYELLQIPMSDGFKLEASILKPPGFDANKKYPVWLMTYAGPHAPTVSDTWGGGRVSDELLAQMGIVVFRTDPRSASGKGAVSAWSAYKQLGIPELKDLEEAVTWLAKTYPWIDDSRVGIAGGSYGGFMTAFALTHSKLFSAGISSFPVTDWRDYDSIYTERYMGLPQDNPEGYDSTSVIKAAKNLHGKLLLIHGTMDDNVHMLNSIKLVRALQDANKTFEFMLYPGSRHGVGSEHYRKLTIDFIARALEVERDETEVTETRDEEPRRRRGER